MADTKKPIPPFDPKLRSVMHELQGVLNKHDVGGLIILTNGEGNSEFRLFIDTPSWSTIRFIKDGEGIHFKGHSKSKPVETNKTVNMVWHLLDMLGENFLRVDKIKKMIQSHFEIEETKSGETFHGPYDDDKGPAS